MDANNTSEPWDYFCYIHELALAGLKDTNDNDMVNTKCTGINCAVDNLQLLINSMYINQVLKMVKITHIPNQHKCIKGLASIENKLTAIVDLQYLLLSTTSKLTEKSCLILLNTDYHMPIALIFDEVYNKISLATTDLINLNKANFKLPKAMLEFVDQAYNYQGIIYDFDINKFLASKLFSSIDFN